ncbi:MAG: hypothetical protein VX498_03715 [Myxococcota bacterium]|nr:hypothetical protein [Myxococcota bacterium]
MKPIFSRECCFGCIALAAALLLIPASTWAGEISSADTSYIGAVMLAGELDVTFDDVYTGQDAVLTQENYAFFSGNTLYVGTEDEAGNALDTIIEFFWFESSIDRQSDFYVAVIKARSNPNIDEDWYLEVEDSPVLSVQADTDISSGGSAAFRWDWCVPFENYGMDSYGSTTLTTAYGIGANVEGSALAQESYDADGLQVQGTIQSRGYVSSEYKVETQYQVILYRWDLEVDGSPGTVQWDMTLNTDDREEENAYHEYFLVMQVGLDEPFTIEALTLGAGYDEWNWGLGDLNFASVVLSGLTLSRPDWSPPGDDDDDDTSADDDDAVQSDDDDSQPVGDDDDAADDDDDGASVPTVTRGCSVGAGAQATGLLALLGFGLLGLGRRRL